MSVKVINETSIRTSLVRISYPKIFKPVPKTDATTGQPIVDAQGNQTLQYTCAFLIPKKDKELVAAIETMMKNAAKAKFGEKVPAKWKAGLRDGDTDPAALVDATDESKGRKPEYVGHYWINATARQKPRIFGREKDEFNGGFAQLTETDIKAGDYVWAQINAYGFDVGTNKGVAFGFAGIQLREVGEALAGNAFAEDAFEDDDELADSFE